MEEKIYNILRKHNLPLKKREALIKDILQLLNINDQVIDIKMIDCEFEKYWGIRDVDFATKMCHYAGFCAGFAGRNKQAKYQEDGK